LANPNLWILLAVLFCGRGMTGLTPS